MQWSVLLSMYYFLLHRLPQFVTHALKILSWKQGWIVFICFYYLFLPTNVIWTNSLHASKQLFAVTLFYFNFCFNQLEKLEAARGAWLVVSLSLLSLTWPYLALLSFTKPYWASLSLTGPYLALLDLTGPYWNLLSLTVPFWALLGFTGPYCALLGITGPYWALLSLTGPYLALLGLILHLSN